MRSKDHDTSSNQLETKKGYRNYLQSNIYWEYYSFIFYLSYLKCLYNSKAWIRIFCFLCENNLKKTEILEEEILLWFIHCYVMHSCHSIIFFQHCKTKYEINIRKTLLHVVLFLWRLIICIRAIGQKGNAVVGVF